MKRKTRNEEIILDHLKKYKTITSWEAIEKYGIQSLPVYIHNLRKEHDIEGKVQLGKNRRNQSSRWMIYSLKRKRLFGGKK